jgi:hypothetical protein
MTPYGRLAPDAVGRSPNAATASWLTKVKRDFANDLRVSFGNSARHEGRQLDKDSLRRDVIPIHQGLQFTANRGIGHVGFNQLEKMSPKFFDCHF